VIRAAVLFFVAVTAWAQVAVPPLTARVTDLTGTLTREQQAGLERMLQEFEARKGTQLAVLMVPTTAPEAIEQYALRVGEQWKIGRRRSTTARSWWWRRTTARCASRSAMASRVC
jgi:uncharacterized protein